MPVATFAVAVPLNRWLLQTAGITWPSEQVSLLLLRRLIHARWAQAHPNETQGTHSTAWATACPSAISTWFLPFGNLALKDPSSLVADPFSRLGVRVRAGCQPRARLPPRQCPSPASLPANFPTALPLPRPLCHLLRSTLFCCDVLTWVSDPEMGHKRRHDNKQKHLFYQSGDLFFSNYEVFRVKNKRSPPPLRA